MYLEAIILCHNLMSSLMESEEKDLIDIHFQQINRLSIVLYAKIEPISDIGS